MKQKSQLLKLAPIAVAIALMSGGAVASTDFSAECEPTKEAIKRSIQKRVHDRAPSQSPGGYMEEVFKIDEVIKVDTSAGFPSISSILERARNAVINVATRIAKQAVTESVNRASREINGEISNQMRKIDDKIEGRIDDAATGLFGETGAKYFDMVVREYQSPRSTSTATAQRNMDKVSEALGGETIPLNGQSGSTGGVIDGATDFFKKLFN